MSNVKLAAQNEKPEVHRLGHKWTLWYDNPNGKQRMNLYGQTLKPILTFDTVEDFWCLYDNIRSPSKLQPNATYYVFKDTVEPRWEDSTCKDGGCWSANIPKGPGSKETLDTWWLYAVLSCLGEQYDDIEDICGVAVKNRRSQERIELWSRAGADEALQARIAKQFKAALELPDSVHIGYVLFRDKMEVANGGGISKPPDHYVV